MKAGPSQSKTDGAHVAVQTAAVAWSEHGTRRITSRLSARSGLFTELHQLLDGGGEGTCFGPISAIVRLPRETGLRSRPRPRARSCGRS